MEERKIRELNYKVQMINVKLMSDSRSGDAAYTDIIKKINQEKVSIPIREDRHMIPLYRVWKEYGVCGGGDMKEDYVSIKDLYILVLLNRCVMPLTSMRLQSISRGC